VGCNKLPNPFQLSGKYHLIVIGVRVVRCLNGSLYIIPIAPKLLLILIVLLSEYDLNPISSILLYDILPYENTPIFSCTVIGLLLADAKLVPAFLLPYISY